MRRGGDLIRDLAEHKHLLLYPTLHLRIIPLVNTLNTLAWSHPAGGGGEKHRAQPARLVCTLFRCRWKTIKAGIQEAAS